MGGFNFAIKIKLKRPKINEIRKDMKARKFIDCRHFEQRD